MTGYTWQRGILVPAVRKAAPASMPDMREAARKRLRELRAEFAAKCKGVCRG